MGQVATILFYGILLAVFTRFLDSSAWRRASISLRLIIIWVVCLATVSMGLGVHDVWHYSSLVADDVNVVLSGTMAQAVEPLISGATAFTVQTVLVLRVAKVVTKRYYRWLFMGVMFAGAMLSFIVSCLFCAYSVSYRLNTFEKVTADIGLDWNTLFEMWLFSGAAVDIIITIVYIFALRKRLGGGTETTDSVLRLIVICAVRCAAYTSIVAIAGAILAPIFPSDTSFITYAFWEPLATLYALSLFTTLGVADSITAKLSDPALQRVSGLGTKSGGSSNGGVLPRVQVEQVGGAGAGMGELGNGGGVLKAPSIAPSRRSNNDNHRRIEDLDVDLDLDLDRDYNDDGGTSGDSYSDAERGQGRAHAEELQSPSRLGLGRTPSAASLTPAGRKAGGGIKVDVERVEVAEKEGDLGHGGDEKKGLL
ncbi:hypothetical protein JCM6882_008169 [Rhodosporidiobolus microsporus]